MWYDPGEPGPYLGMEGILRCLEQRGPAGCSAENAVGARGCDDGKQALWVSQGCRRLGLGCQHPKWRQGA